MPVMGICRSRITGSPLTLGELEQRIAGSQPVPQVLKPASILATPIHLSDGKSLQGAGLCLLQAAVLVRCTKTWTERNEKQVEW